MRDSLLTDTSKKLFLMDGVNKDTVRIWEIYRYWYKKWELISDR